MSVIDRTHDPRRESWVASARGPAEFPIQNLPLGGFNPNYKYVPVAYHSRASSVRPSGVPIRRPRGQRKAVNEDTPSFGPAQKLDYELELAVWIGPGNELGEPIPIAQAGDHVFGLGLVND